MTWTEFTQKAMYVPFVEHGRDYLGWDCWGLVVCAYRDVLDIELPDNHEDYSTTHDFKKLSQSMVRDRDTLWKPCNPDKDGAVALIMRRSRPIHVGIFMRPDYILHCEENVNTLRQKTTYLRFEGFYEYAC